MDRSYVKNNKRKRPIRAITANFVKYIELCLDQKLAEMELGRPGNA